MEASLSQRGGLHLGSPSPEEVEMLEMPGELWSFTWSLDERQRASLQGREPGGGTGYSRLTSPEPGTWLQQELRMPFCKKETDVLTRGQMAQDTRHSLLLLISCLWSQGWVTSQPRSLCSCKCWWLVDMIQCLPLPCGCSFKVKVLVTQLCPTLQGPITWQAPLSVAFPRQEYWSRLPVPSPGDLPDPALKLMSPAWQADPLPLSHLGNLNCSFSLVQFSRSVMPNSLWPHESQHARPPCPSPTPGVYSNSCPSSQWCHPAISSSVIPFSSCPQSPPASGSFPKSQLFTWGGPKYWSFSFSISPSNEHPGLISSRMDWLDLLAVQGTLKSLLQHHSSKASILWRSAFFTVQLSHPYMTTGITIALMRRIFVESKTREWRLSPPSSEQTMCFPLHQGRHLRFISSKCVSLEIKLWWSSVYLLLRNSHQKH